jgi:glucose-6-phosphate isomerase
LTDPTHHGSKKGAGIATKEQRTQSRKGKQGNLTTDYADFHRWDTNPNRFKQAAEAETPFPRSPDSESGLKVFISVSHL